MGSTAIQTLPIWHPRTRFDDQVSAYSIQQAISAMWRSVSAHLKYVEICTFSIIFAKPGLMANILLILVLPSFWSLRFFPMSVLSFTLNCWLRSRTSRDLVRPVTRRRLIDAPSASVNYSSNLQERFRVRVETGPEGLQRVSPYENSDHCNWAGFTIKNLEFQHHNFSSN